MLLEDFDKYEALTDRYRGNFVAVFSYDTRQASFLKQHLYSEEQYEKF